MIGFAGIVLKGSVWNSTFDEGLSQMTRALEGARSSQTETVHLESAGVRKASFVFITNSLRPIIVQNHRTLLLLYGNIFTSEALGPQSVLQACLDNNGDDAIHNLNGGYTLVRFNKESGLTEVFRDRGGIKVVFHHDADRYSLLATGLRAIAKCNLFQKRDIDEEGLWMNIAYPAPTQPLTCFKHVKAVERGAVLSIDQGPDSVRHYWELPSRKLDHSMSMDEAAKLTHETLSEAVRIRVKDQKNIGSTLSGGVDSAYLTSLAHHHNPEVEAFTFKLKGSAFDAVNEDDVASLTAQKFNIKHHIEAFDFEDFTEDLGALVRLYEQPGLSLGVYYTISGIASKLGYKSVITGLAADELFGGFHYFKHLEYRQWLRLLNPIAQLLPANRHKGIDKFKRIAGADSIDEYYSRAFAGYLDHELKQLFLNSSHISSEIQQRLYNPGKQPFEDDTSGLMHYMFSNCPNHHLYRFETFANHFGISPIYPFLDNNMIDVALSIPSQHKVRGHKRKIVLKKAASPWVEFPALTEKKRGVGAPVNAWMNNKLKELTDEKIRRLKQRGIFNTQYIDEVIMKYPAPYGKKIWKLVMTEMWFEEFID